MSVENEHKIKKERENTQGIKIMKSPQEKH